MKMQVSHNYLNINIISIYYLRQSQLHKMVVSVRYGHKRTRGRPESTPTGPNRPESDINGHKRT